MWSNTRPPSRSAAGDVYNNNSSAPNPYSRNAAAVSKSKPGRQSTDPWDWGYEDNSQQDDRSNGWSQSQAPAPNVIPNTPAARYPPAHSTPQTKPEKKPPGTPDLIPDKVPTRGNIMPMGPKRYPANNFFENIDLVAQNNQTTPLPPVYGPDGRRPQQPNLPQNHPPMFQPVPPKSSNSHNTAYFPPHPNSFQPVNNESPYYPQPPPPSTHNPNMYRPPQYFQPESNKQSATPAHRGYYGPDHLATANQDPSGQLYNQSQSQPSNKHNSSVYNQGQFVALKPDTSSNFYERDQVTPPQQANISNYYNQNQPPSELEGSSNFYNQGHTKGPPRENSGNFYNQDQVNAPNHGNSDDLYYPGLVKAPDHEKSDKFYNPVQAKAPHQEKSDNNYNLGKVKAASQENNDDLYNASQVKVPHQENSDYNPGQVKAPFQENSDIFHNPDQEKDYSQETSDNFYNPSQVNVPPQKNSDNFFNKDCIEASNQENSDHFYNQIQGNPLTQENREEVSGNVYKQEQVNSHFEENSSNFYSQDQVKVPPLDNSGNFYNKDPTHDNSVKFLTQDQVNVPPNDNSVNLFTQDQVKVPPRENSVNFYNQGRASAHERGNYFGQNVYPSSSRAGLKPASTHSDEVENVEVAPPERRVNHAMQAQPPLTTSIQDQQKSQAAPLTTADEHSIPDNQETLSAPENQEQLPSLTQKHGQMKINPSHNLETWNNAAGWENQEIAPRCELDRNQYLETGQLDSNEAEEVPPEIDNNDEGEALPPPGLHRMVTGQGTEPPSGLERLVPGEPTPSASPTPSQRHPRNPHIVGRMVPGQLSDDDSDFSVSTHRTPWTDENNLSSSELERMIPGGTSEHEISFPGAPGGERMVPGGLSDDSRSQSVVNDDVRNSGPTDGQAERLVTGGGSTERVDTSLSGGSQETVSRGPVSQPPPGLHRLVLGQLTADDAASSNTDHASVKPSERVEDCPGGNPPHGMHRMVVGQFREKEDEPENDKDKEKTSAKIEDREEDDSDSDYRDRRRHRHRKDSYTDERKERDYSSEREYRGRREDRREYRKKRERDNSYNRSPEYPSDQEDYERSDYRDRRDRDRRHVDRPRDRDRRRRSPDYSYDPYYRDDPRKVPPRERDRRYYEPYDDDPYYYRENRSRPSSRSGSEYRRHRDYPPRQPYYPEQGGGMGMTGYHQMHYMQMQHYYENLRRTDPAAYALWYERYMAEKYGSSSASHDRASVHSGRSDNDTSQLHEKLLRRRLMTSTPFHSPVKSQSSMDSRIHHNLSSSRLSHHLEEEDTEGVKAEDEASHRSTPPLFNSTHIRGHFSAQGQLVVVNPHDPFSYGEHQATVTVCRVAGANAADSPDTLEFLQNPGPFVSGVTHKNTVQQYLKKQSDQSSHSSEKLLYELIRLVIKLNGVVDMTDVADLLMESYRGSNAEADYFPATQEADDTPPLSPQQITTKFRELLLEGNKTEALEWAMKNKDWGHALFLASKMDSRTHNNVMLRFANGLQNNDPLQTLYQLMSGREPQASTCAADKKWGDWRPHLAMMLSNRTANVELDRKSILSLGDSLGARGRLSAAHFCYLTAQLEFSHYSDRQPKLVLLGASPDQPFAQFTTCRAIMLTLCYEFAKQLSNKDWCIPTLRPYKFLLACRLLDHGQLRGALAYLELIARDLTRATMLRGRDDPSLARLVVDLAERIKCADTALSYETDPNADPDWLAELKVHLQESNDPNYLLTHLSRGISTSTVSDLDPLSAADQLLTQPVVQDVNQAYAPEMTNYQHYNSGVYSQENHYYDPSQNNYYKPQAVQNHQEVPQVSEMNPPVDPSPDYWSGWDPQQQQQTVLQEEQPTEPQTAPQVSVKPGFGYYANSEEHIKPQVQQSSAPTVPEKTENKEKSNRRANKTQQGGSGWFGGIWDKLALRPKNQMKLPDDKNPTIVWDEKTKKWVNTDSSQEEQSAQLKPPPRASELPESSFAPTNLPAATNNASVPTSTHLPPPSGTNKYKMQRNRGTKGNYVDVMGSSTKPVTSTANPPPAFAAQPQAAVTNFFVPAPVPGNENAPVDFLSPSGPVSYEPSSSKSDDHAPQLSRSSSASSLSREVTYYMSRRQPGPRPGGFGKGNATFYNPSSFQ